MAEFCKICRSELQENAAICPECGAILHRDPVYAASENPKQDKKKAGKWWLIPIAAVLALIVVAAVFWKPLLLTFAPRIYLGMAASNTMEALEKRGEGSPAALLETVGECMNKGTMTLEQSYYGYTASTVTLRSDIEAKQWAMNSKTNALLTTIESNLYLDADCLAVQIPGYTGGAYYGLTFDTFSEDLKNSSLGEQLSDEQIQSCQQAVQKIDGQIDSVTSKDALEAYVSIWVEYVKELKPDTGTHRIEMNNEDYNTHTVSYTLTVEEMLKLMEQTADQMERDGISFADDVCEALDQSDGSMSGYADVVFYIYDMHICAIGFDFDLIEDDTYSPVAIDLVLTLGPAPETDDMVADIYACLDGYEVQLHVTSSVDRKEGTYKNVILVDRSEIRSSIDGTIEQSDVSFRLSTNWDDEKGILEFYINNTPCTLEVTETESGVKLITDDLYAFTDTSESIFGDMIRLDQTVKISFTRGCEIEKPVYTNLDQIQSGNILDLFGFEGSEGIDQDHSFENDWILWQLPKIPPNH